MANKTYQIITDRIVDRLKEGIIPWKKPWNPGQPQQNPFTKNVYHGINQLLLNSMGYSQPYWATFKQISKMGKSVRKGAKGVPIIFASFKETEKIKSDGSIVEGKFFFYRYYTVFNVAQTNIILPEDEKPKIDFEPIGNAEKIIELYSDIGPRVNHGGQDRAFYRPSTDQIYLPDREIFTGEPEYYSTIFHEFGHSTGHSKRWTNKTGRPGIMNHTGFGSHAYSEEELVAEITSCFLCSEANILESTGDNSQAYINNWIKALKDNPTFIVKAAQQAEKAANIILKRKKEYKNQGGKK